MEVGAGTLEREEMVEINGGLSGIQGRDPKFSVGDGCKEKQKEKENKNININTKIDNKNKNINN
jgi:hypothetical protein